MQRRSSVDNYVAGQAGGQRRMSSVVQAKTTGAERGVYMQNDENLRKMSLAVPNLAEITKDASAAAENERTMSFREGVRLYPKAIFFSFGLSLAVVMEGELDKAPLTLCVQGEGCPSTSSRVLTCVISSRL